MMKFKKKCITECDTTLNSKIIEISIIRDKIYALRENRIMFDFDLSELYEVEPRVLKQKDNIVDSD